MMPVTVRGLDEARARLFDRDSRVVGWGTGSVFDYFQGRHPIRLDYVVDNDSSRWGQTRHGVTIASPARLCEEDARHTIVVIYSSFWPEIQGQIAGMGDFAAVPASAAFADVGVREKLAWFEELAGRPWQPHRPRGENAIVVQGPVIPAVTAVVLRALTALHPESLVVLSTWDDTDPVVLTDVARYVDQIVLSVKPRVPGIQNRNFQIVSTRAGIARAIEHGARHILKTRTDLAVLATSLFEQARWWLDRVGHHAARAAGLRERLIVPSSFTRKFLLYHPSDLVMLGTAADMACYWSAPLDARSGELLSPEWTGLPLSVVNMTGNPTESYLGLQFCRELGRPIHGTTSDSWAFYRDMFTVVENDWFDMLWLKNMSIPDAALRGGLRQMVTQGFWQRLHARDSTVDADLALIDPDHVRLGLLAGAA